MRFIIVFVAAVGFMSLIKLKWPKSKNIYDIDLIFFSLFQTFRAERVAGSAASGMLSGSSTNNVRGLHQKAFSRSTSSLRKIAADAPFLENGQPKNYRRTVFSSDHR